jgi:tetratricopeptide (TPR) repeat protein
VALFLRFQAYNAEAIEALNMDPERFRQIKELYDAARESTRDQRAALLAQADPELRLEVESLLARQSDNLILDRPAAEAGGQQTEDPQSSMPAVGTCLGPYRVEGKLGEGGMGTVLRAVDTRMGRPVAVKIAHERFSARFEREVRAISSLNHPNICTLHDVGPNYLVMELVEGETLSSTLKKGPLSTEVALHHARQILAALAEAHGRGIIHRDLKPGNIMLTKTGVKVLDFGLATLEGDTTTLASEHMVMGTPAYMAPEQRQGKPADARTDLYSFGCVLYEMLTGARATAERKPVPAKRLEKIVSRCLETDPARRWQTAGEITKALESTPAAFSKRLWIACGAAVFIVVVVASLVFLRPVPKLTDKDTVVLADFVNNTRDPIFDGTLRQGLAIQLEQSPFLNIMADRQVQSVLLQMKLSRETRVTNPIANEICVREGAAATIGGDITSLGNTYVITLAAIACSDGRTLARQQIQAADKERVLNAVGTAATAMRGKLGESLNTIEKLNRPLEQGTTASLEALKAYSVGWNAVITVGADGAIPHLQRAIQIDPQFALAHAQLGFQYSNMGETVLAAEHTRKAYELRDRVSDREMFFILTLYDREVTGNLQKELQTLESWVQTYPRDGLAVGLVGGWAALGTGQYERGFRAAQEALRLNPDDPYGHQGLFTYSLLRDKFDDAAGAMNQAAERKLELSGYIVNRYYLAFFKGDQAGMEREIARAAGVGGMEHFMSHSQALVLARSGQMQRARTMWEHSIALAQQAGELEKAALYEAAEAVCEAHFLNRAEAKRHAEAALQLAKGRDVEYAAAFALALSGDSAGSERLAESLQQRFPEDTPVQFEYLPTLRARSALARQAPLDAVERLQRALPYDFALPGTAFNARFGGLYPAYVRGQAYLEAGRGREAAAEFQKVLEHRGVVSADPISALAHLQLGRALVLSGDKDKARSAYQEFLTLWKDADPDIPILKQAKAEYSKL